MTTENLYNQVFVEAGTGQGKSYKAMLNALRYACVHRGRVVIATSTLFLVDQVYKEIKDLKEQHIENGIVFSNLVVSIEKHTSNELLQPGKLLTLFENGNCIIITVHNYLKEIDDYNSLTPFYCLLMPFIKQTIVIVDEEHLFLEDTSVRHLIEESWGLVSTTNSAIRSSIL